MSESTDRRTFLVSAWKAGLAFLAAAGIWTSWDVLRPRLAAGFGARVKTVSPDAVPTDSVLEVFEARAYLTKVNDEIVAFSEICSHLGCRVPFCQSSGQFECPCHGSVFNRAGDHLTGPAPRGMDRFAVEIEDGIVVIDTNTMVDGPPPGTVTVDEPSLGPACSEESHG
ncbi:MAG: ubiquinol-cytochrome c reductase iron-sulfur subunit [Acidimicrobiia bacterium]|nr:ubiquinol-cytochrome c reductase iron-sulfur subunit [Acidimicrobiia bacterium]